jgi:phosphatidylserine/phosphatidylglycerophosphate/cardiolipin synthase-like enzyme
MKKLLLALTMGLAIIQPCSADDIQDHIRTFYTPFDQGECEQAVIQVIDQAREEIKGNAYGLTDPQFVDALIAAKKRGVDVVFTVDATQAAGPHQRPLIQDMQMAGIDVQIGKSPKHGQLLHMKGFEVDQQIVEDGSWNFSPSASYQFNFVNLMYSPKRAQMFLQAWQQIYNHIAPQGQHSTITTKNQLN